MAKPILPRLTSLRHLFTVDGEAGLASHAAAGIAVGAPIYGYEQWKLNRLKKKQETQREKSAYLEQVSEIQATVQHPCF